MTTKFKIFTFFHIILHCKTPENHVKSSFHDYCYRHFFFFKCFGLTSNIRKITPKCSFSITFLLDKNYGGNASAPKSRPCKAVEDFCRVFKDMTPEVRSMFQQD